MLNFYMSYIQLCDTLDQSQHINSTNSFTDFFKINDNIKNDTFNIETLNGFLETIEYAQFESLNEIKEPLRRLSKLVGLESIKNNIIEQILYYYQELHNENDYLHTIICGPPGTGKTEVSKIIGEIFSKLGVLKNKTFKKVTRNDLIAGYLGQTALKTKKVVEEAIGGVLFIDEVYSLGNKDKTDTFSKECIDTLCDALSEHKNELMVIIAGYEKDIEECFFSYNKGLKSRFIWKYNIEKYSTSELYSILVRKIISDKWTYCQSTINQEWFLEKEDAFKYFGRDIEQLLSKVKICHSKRIFGKSNSIKKKITLDDLNNGYEKFTENKHDTENDTGYLKMYT